MPLTLSWDRDVSASLVKDTNRFGDATCLQAVSSSARHHRGTEGPQPAPAIVTGGAGETQSISIKTPSVSLWNSVVLWC